jgi:hypothetical protein
MLGSNMNVALRIFIHLIRICPTLQQFPDDVPFGCRGQHSATEADLQRPRIRIRLMFQQDTQNWKSMVYAEGVVKIL